MMTPVVEECRRVVKPTGSAVFIIQPNSERVGRTRLWWLRFMLQWGESWGIVQDAWWWNTSALPQPTKGQLTPACKPCVWLGDADCYRNPLGVVREPKRKSKEADISRPPSGWRGDQKPRYHDRAKMNGAVERNGGSWPHNIIDIGGTSGGRQAGSTGHPAGTPMGLVRWWIRYICPPGGRVLDPFMGSGTTALAAMAEGRTAAGSERMEKYVQIARTRIAEAGGKPIAPTPPQSPRHWLDFRDLDINHYANSFGS